MLSFGGVAGRAEHIWCMTLAVVELNTRTTQVIGDWMEVMTFMHPSHMSEVMDHSLLRDRWSGWVTVVAEEMRGYTSREIDEGSPLVATYYTAG